MARVTVEDCIEKVPNRFGLVLMAGHRARSIANGATWTMTFSSARMGGAVPAPESRAKAAKQMAAHRFHRVGIAADSSAGRVTQALSWERSAKCRQSQSGSQLQAPPQTAARWQP